MVDGPKLEMFSARKVLHSIRGKVKEEFDRMEQMGIIKPMSDSTPAVSPMIVVDDRNCKLGLCIGLWWFPI